MKISRVLLLLFCLISTVYYFGLAHLTSIPIMRTYEEEDAFTDTICKKTSMKYLSKEDRQTVKSICKGDTCITNMEYSFFFTKMRYQKNASNYIKNHLIWLSIYLFIAFFSNKHVNKFHNYWLYACFVYAIIVTSYYIWEILREADMLF